MVVITKEWTNEQLEEFVADYYSFCDAGESPHDSIQLALMAFDKKYKTHCLEEFKKRREKYNPR